MGCVSVFKDSYGTCVLGFEKNLGVISVLPSELWGILIALETGWTHGFLKFYLDSDSRVTVMLVKNDCDASHSYYNIVARICMLCDKECNIYIGHTWLTCK